MAKFRNHGEFTASLSKLVDPQIAYPLLNDPQFRDRRYQRVSENTTQVSENRRGPIAQDA